MRSRLRPSLAAKIVLLAVGISGALALSLTALGYRKAAQGLFSRSETALSAEARLTASLVDSWTRERVQGLRALAALRSVRRLLETAAAAPVADDLDAADRALGDLTALASDVDSVAIVGLSGKVVRGSNANEDGRDLSQHPDVREALAGRLAVSGVSLSQETGAPAIFFAAPTLGSNGTVIGCVRMRAKLDPLRDFVQAAKDRAGPGAQGELIDGAGLVVASTFAPELSLAARVLPVLHGAGTVHFLLQGVEQLGVAHPLSNTRYIYVASLPVSEVQRTAGELLRNAIVAAAAGLLAALVLSLLVARRVVASVKRLTEVSARVVSEGDLTQQIEVTSDDEVGQLGRSFARMVEALREALTTLKGSAGALSAAADNLRGTMDELARFIESQATTLQETQVTAQEIKQTSALAAQKAQAVLEVAERAEEIGRAGESSVERSLGGLEVISKQAVEVSEQIKQLSESARQIGSIAGTVKDLADQSNMLALNAAIEAVRSGEHGKGFGIVAREIRSLADQSINATNRVREILGEVTGAIRAAVSINDVSTRRMEAGMVEVKSSGANLRELSGITRENAAAVRQIAAAVNQQNAGISQIFGAVTEQMKMMEQVREHIERTNRASAELREVAERVAGTLGRYRI